MRPLIGLFTGSDRVIVVEKPSELLEYFDEDQLLLLSYSDPSESESVASSAATDVSVTSEGEGAAAGEGGTSSSDPPPPAAAAIEYSDNIGSLITKGDRDHIANGNETIRR